MVPNFSLLKLYFCRKVSAFRSRVENIPAITEANDYKLQNHLYFQYAAYELRIMFSFLNRQFTIVFTVIGINQTAFLVKSNISKTLAWSLLLLH